MQVIKPGQVVKFHFILRNGATGDLLDTSEEDDPMAYLHGHQELVPGLVEALEGRSLGEVFEVTIPVQRAFGPHDPDGVFTIDRSQLPPELVPTVGMTLSSEMPHGDIAQLQVIAVEGQQVTVDANHPLSGIDLHYRIQVLELRDATAEEIEHKHAHEGAMAHDHSHGHSHDHGH